MHGTSKPRSQRISARSRRDALYATLEDAVREDFSKERNGGDDTVRIEGASTSAKTYPYPIIWYEEMSPSDLDAYHAACSSDQTTPCSSTVSPVSDSQDQKGIRPLQHGNQKNAPPKGGELLQSNPCAHSARGLITEATTLTQARMPTAVGSGSGMLSSLYSSSFSHPPHPKRHEKERNVTTLGGSVDPVLSSRVSEARSRKPLPIWTSQTPSPTPARVEGVRTGAMCSEPDRGIRTLDWRVSEAVAAAAGVGKETRWQEAIFQPLSSAVDSSTTGASSWQRLFSRCPSQIMGAEDSPDGEGKEVGEPFPNDSRFIRGKEPTSTPTLPPEPSQGTLLATQTMFMPGLPSQVLVSQQVEDGTCGDYQEEPKDEEESLGSEHDLWPPLTCLPTPSASIKQFPDGRASESGGARSAAEGAECAQSRLGTGRQGVGRSANNAENSGHNYRRINDKTPRRAQVYEGFIRALEAFAVGTGGANSEVIDEQGSEPIEPGYRDRNRFALVSTEEVLPTTWAGRQAEVVAALESHLLRARDRAPEGYAVRALELACRILSRPRVCVHLGEGRVGPARRTPPQRAVFSEGSREGEIVGVAGLVWEILRTEKDIVQEAPAPAGAADAQLIRKALGK